MVVRKGGLTGSKRVKEQSENSVGARAKRVADEAIASLGNVSQVTASPHSALQLEVHRDYS